MPSVTARRRRAKPISVANTTPNGSASENSEGFAAGAAAKPKSARTKPEGIGALFRKAAKAFLGGNDDEQPQPKQRRRGEAEGQFGRMARYLWRRCDVRQSFKGRAAIASRYAPIDREAYAVATKYLSGTLDMLDRLDGSPGSDHGSGFNAISSFNSPHL